MGSGSEGTALANAAAARRVTLADIAAAAQCSLPVASKALSGRPYVAPETRRRVLEVAHELGYKPRQRRSAPFRRNAILAVFDGFGSPYSSELFTGALHAARAVDLEVSALLLPSDDAVETRRWIDVHAASGASGAFVVTSVITPTFVEAAQEQGLPLVAVDPKSRLDGRVVTIGAANWDGAASGVRHLLDLGHTRIGFVGRDLNAIYAMERYAGYVNALGSAGIRVDERWVLGAETHFEDGLDAGLRIARLADRPTAVMCVCDTVAFGVIEGLRREGLQTPGDISVVGFDDLPQAQWVSPPLTSVRQPLQRMGALAVRTLLRMMRGREPESFHVQVPTSLVPRGTSAPAPEH